MLAEQAEQLPPQLARIEQHSPPFWREDSLCPSVCRVVVAPPVKLAECSFAPASDAVASGSGVTRFAGVDLQELLRSVTAVSGML